MTKKKLYFVISFHFNIFEKLVTFVEIIIVYWQTRVYLKWLIYNSNWNNTSTPNYISQKLLMESFKCMDES